MSTAGLKYGPFTLHWYGIIVAVAIAASLALAVAMALYRHRRPDPLASMLLLGLLSGLIGARLWYYLFRRDWYSPDPGRIFALWQGGMALHGAIAGALIALAVYCWKHDLSFWQWSDICAPGMILGQAIGRLGDLVNQQAFGLPTTGALFVTIPRENRPLAYVDFAHFTPTAAYEAAWDLVVLLCLLGLTLLQKWRPRWLPSGSIVLADLALYSLGRLPLEGMRLDSLYLHGFRVAQLASSLLIAASVVVYAVRLLAVPESAESLPQPLPHGQVTEAYLLAAARSSQTRLGHGPQEWDDLDDEGDDEDEAPKGRPSLPVALPAPAATVIPNIEARAALPPAEEAL